jgi:hypothetical protein
MNLRRVEYPMAFPKVNGSRMAAAGLSKIKAGRVIEGI